jgi:2-oxoglutarate dehydrogenase complex dehydrogenase (E1) component-like enzyme
MKKKSTECARFEIRFYEGYKGREIPRAVVIGRREFKIDEILERKRALDHKTGESSEIFTCLMEGKPVRITLYDSGRFDLTYL